MYVVHNNAGQREYNVPEAYLALKQFKVEYGLDSLDGVFIRSFGGKDQPAQNLWPRRR